MEFFVTTSRGLEECLAQEILDLGGQDIVTVPGGVALQGEPSMLLQLNLHLKTALRVLVPLAEEECHNGNDLYDFAQTIDWSEFIDSNGTLAVQCVGRGTEGLRHSRYASLRVKDAIVDQFRDRFGERPDVDRDMPQLAVHLHLRDEHALLSLDSSAVSLHKRGYRLQSGPAALRETLGAGVIQYTSWDKRSPFIDFMCGSGTLAIEAARLALGIPPGANREHFGYWGWNQSPDGTPAPSENDHLSVLAKLPRTPKEDMPLILGFDQDPEMVELAEENAHRAGVADFVRFEQRSVEDTKDLPDPLENGILICNPPYGERLGNEEDLKELYGAIGDVYKQQGQGYRGFILTGNTGLAKSVGLRASRRRPIWNGPIECRLLSYELYAGTKRRKATAS